MRPKPNIILEYVQPTTYKATQIIELGELYSVFYKNTPINIREGNKLINHPQPRYKKTTFSCYGNANVLAKKLNKKFNTKDFNVQKLIGGGELNGKE